MNATQPATIEPFAGNVDVDSGPPSPASLCADAGWAFSERRGACLVKLEVNRQGPPFHARLERAADGGIAAWVDLTAAAQELAEAVEPRHEPGAPPVPSPCRRAVEAMLAEVSGRIPMVRGVLRDGSRGPIAGFEAHIARAGAAEQLADVLSVLSVACELSGPEIQLLLTDPVVAEAYLSQINRACGSSTVP
jgi:hypothetical protein